MPFDDDFTWGVASAAYQVEGSTGADGRVGIVHTEYVTQARTPKDSAYWYRDVIATNGREL